MKRPLMGLLIAAVLIAGFIFYRYYSSDNLNVTPEAREQIEKAKRR
jgi:hypothetical protein